MSLEIQNYGATLIVSVYGDFDLSATDFCRRDIDQRLKAQGVKDLLFDLGRVTFIDSSGLGVILGRYRKVTEHGGKVAIANVDPGIARILELSGLKRLIPFFPTVALALKELSL